MAKTATLNIRIDPEIKAAAEELFSMFGITMFKLGHTKTYLTNKKQNRRNEIVSGSWGLSFLLLIASSFSLFSV